MLLKPMMNFPVVLYWKGEIPHLYPGDIEESEALLEWITLAKSGDTIELVTEEILEDMVRG